MRPILLAVAALLVGCATTEQFQKNMDTFVGGTESDLVAVMGPPQSVYDPGDGTRILQFSSSRTVVTPGMTTYQPVTTNTYGRFGSTNYNSMSTTYVPQQGPAMAFQQSCTINFRVSSSRVVGWTAQGNACKATPPR